MFEILRILLLTAHLLSVNVAAGAPVVCLGLEWRRGRASRDAAGYLAAASLIFLGVGGLLGLLLGLLEWDSDYQAVWDGQLGRKVFFAVFEFVFSTVLLLGYWFWPKRNEPPAWLSLARSLLLLVAAANLLYHFPPLFFNGQKLLDRQGDPTPLSSADFRQMMFFSETLPLTVHFVIASVAVAGLALVHLALRWRRRGREQDAHWAAAAGSRWSLGATLLQLPVGLWTLVALPRSMQNELIGGNPLGLVVFASAMITALWLTRELVNLAMGETDRGPILRAMLAMLLTVGLMTMAHEIARAKRKTAASRHEAAATILTEQPS